MDLLSSVRNLIRFDNWWNTKAVLLLAVCYLCIAVTQVAPEKAALQLVVLIVWIVAAASFGHLLNDVFDIEADRKADKKNFASGLSPRAQRLWLFILGVTAVIPISIFSTFPLMWYLTIFHLCLFIVYSHPLIRLKEYPIAGVITDALYAHVVPVLVIVIFVGAADSFDLLFQISAIIWLLTQGIRNILLHQLADLASDTLSGTSTFVSKAGEEKTYHALNYVILPTEILCLFVCLIWLSLSGYSWLTFPVLIFLFMKIFLQLPDLLIEKNWQQSNHPSFSLLNNLYEQLLPLIFLTLLTLQQHWFGLFIFVHLLLFAQPFNELLNTLKNFGTKIRYVLRS